MTRKIDFSKPLSEDEQRYVADRPWLLTDARLRGEDIITDDDFIIEDLDDDTSGAEDDEDDESDEDSEGESEDDSEESDDESEDDDEDEVAPYVEWDYADLKAEAKRRELSQAGSKEQLITRLEQDDTSNPE